MRGVAIIGLILATTASAQADDAKAGSEALYNAIFSSIGSSYHLEKSPCRVSMDMDLAKFIENIDAAKKMGLINSEVTQAKINTSPVTLSMALILQAMPTVTRRVYEDNTDIDKCSFVQSLISTDDYGNDKKEMVATYGFTRSIANKINWDKFQNQNLSKVAVGFKYNPSVVLRARAEND